MVADRRYAGPVKKLLLALSLAGAGYAAWRKMEADKAEQDLWAEATDTVR